MNCIVQSLKFSATLRDYTKYQSCYKHLHTHTSVPKPYYPTIDVLSKTSKDQSRKSKAYTLSNNLLQKYRSSYESFRYKQQYTSRKLPAFGLKLTDYLSTTSPDPNEPTLMPLKPATPVFDLYNLKAVPQDLNHSETPKRLHKPKSIVVNSLESATVLALRLKHLKAGKCTLQDVKQLASAIFSDLSPTQTDLELYETINMMEEPIKEVENELVDTAITPKTEKLTETRISLTLGKFGYTHQDLARWVECVSAPSIYHAVKVMEDTKSHKWPTFLLLYTFRRPCNSKLEALELMRLFHVYFQTLDNETNQSKLVLRMIDRALRFVPDLIPDICETFVEKMHSGFLQNKTIWNQILWQLTAFGRFFAVSDQPKDTAQSGKPGKNVPQSHELDLVLASQNIIMKKMQAAGIELDTKGYLALANTLREISPDRARSVLEIVKQHEYPCSYTEKAVLRGDFYGKDKKTHLTGMFPYIQAATCLEILLSKDADEALSALDNGISRFDSLNPEIASQHGYEFATSAMLWSTLFKQLKRTGSLTSEITSQVWQKAVASNVNITPHLLSNVLSGLVIPNPDGQIDYKKVIEFVKEYVLSSTASVSLLAKYLKVVASLPQQVLSKLVPTHVSGLAFVRELVSGMGNDTPGILYNTLLYCELHMEPASMWTTYTRMLRAGHEPDVWTLYYLLRAAYDPKLMWEGYPAAQRAASEFKGWVRGAHLDGSDAADLLKVYPTTKLFYAYTIVCGRSREHDAVLDILLWLERIGLAADKPLLCAILGYAPTQDYLLAHSENSHKDWPTLGEVEWFKKLEFKRQM